MGIFKNNISKLLISFIFLSQITFYGFSDEGGAIIPNVLSLKEAIDIAVLNNRSIQIQQEEIEFARGNVLYGRSLFLPQVNAAFGYTYNNSVLPLSSPSGQTKDPHIFTGYQNDNLATLSVDESIYNGGANIANLEGGKLQLKAQQETLRATRLEVEFETKRLFFGILLAYETRRIAQELVNQAQAHCDDTKTKFNQGTASKFDVLQAKVQVSKLIPQLVNAENAIELIMAEFKKELVLDLKKSVRIEGKLDYLLVEIKEDSFLQEAYSKNPGMILKLLGLSINKWAIEYAKSGWLPQVTASGNYSYRSSDIGNMFNPKHDLWNVGVKASIALFDGFAPKAKVDEARAKYAQADLQKLDLIDQIAVDIKNACLDLKQAKAVIDSQKDVIEEAKEALRLSEVRYNNGVGIALDIFDAQVSLAQIEQNLAQGIYDYIMAKAQLDRIMGKEFFREGSWQ